MTTYICGGSNSVRRGGWSDFLDLPVTNLSVGAATSMMGAYRAIFCADLAPGDTVIWEYALNDSTQSLGNAPGYRPDDLLTYCEATIRHCAARGVRFIPLILTPRKQERKEQTDVYRRKLIRLLRHYGLPFVNVSKTMRRKLNVAVLPDDVYHDNMHYQTNHPVVKYMARQVRRLCEAEFAPVNPALLPFLMPVDFRLDVMRDFAAATPQTFSNQLLSVDVFPPETLPLQAESAGDRRLVGIFLVTTSEGGWLELKITDPDGSVAARYDLDVSHFEPGFEKPMFRMFSFQNATHPPIEILAGQGLTLSMATGIGTPVVSRRATAQDTRRSACTASVAGLLTELR